MSQFADSEIRLVAVDLDGTLLNDSKQISEPTARALACLPERNVKLIIASARPPRSVRQIYHDLELDTLQINYNGALIWDEPRQEVVFHRPIPGELAARIIETARDIFEETIVTCEVLDSWHTDRNDNSFTTETGKLFSPDVIAPVRQICAQPITKVMLLGEPRIVLRLEAVLLKQFDDQVSILKTDRDLLQIMDKRVGKATSLRLIANQYEIAMENVMTIGDAPTMSACCNRPALPSPWTMRILW